jgi:hypothetical protein
VRAAKLINLPDTIVFAWVRIYLYYPFATTNASSCSHDAYTKLHSSAM